MTPVLALPAEQVDLVVPRDGLGEPSADQAAAATSEGEHECILAFICSLPVALERKDLRVVHAAWGKEQIDQCREIDAPIDEAYRRLEAEWI